MRQLAITDDYLSNALTVADWRPVMNECAITVFKEHLHDVDELAARLAPFEIVCCMRERTPFQRELLDKLPNLKLLCSTAQRNAVIDVAYAASKGVVVSGTGASNGATAELTWAIILGFMRNIPGEYNAVRVGGWQAKIGRDVSYLTLGVIGLGRLGAKVAKVGRAFGMEVIAWSPNMTAEQAAACDAKLVTKDELMARAHIVTLHMVLSDRTRGMIGPADIARMRSDALLVNTSRGPLIDEPALIEALQGNRIAGAALDAFEVEPLPASHPFRQLPNVLVTSHVGYVTEATYKIFFEDTVENVLAYLKGKPIRIQNPLADTDRTVPRFLDRPGLR